MIRRIVIVVVALAALAWFGWQWTIRRNAPRPGPAADSVAAGVRSARLYFAAPSGDSLVSEPRELLEAANLHDRVAGLVAELDRGPRGSGVAALPAGTAALHVFLDERGLLTINLSRAFQQGFRGGSGAEYLAVASLVRTLGANLPEVKRVLIVCGGRPIATLGGHLPLDRPLRARHAHARAGAAPWQPPGVGHVARARAAAGRHQQALGTGLARRVELRFGVAGAVRAGRSGRLPRCLPEPRRFR